MNTLATNRRNFCLSRCKSVLLGAAAAAAALLNASAVRPCFAANIVLNSGNSSVTIDQTSMAGVSDWTINGQNQLNQEWFWFRTAGETGQSSLNSLGTPTVDPLGADTTELIYGSSSSLQITVIYSVTGGLSSSYASDLTDEVEIDNHTGKSLSLDFFQYANFNLDDSTTGQSVSINNSTATATVTGNGFQAQTVVSPDPNDYQAGTFSTLLNNISSGTKNATLNDTGTAGPGDTEFAYEWQLNVPMCSSVVLTGDTAITGKPTIVPEPVSAPIAVLGLGGAMLTRPRRRDEDADNRTVQVAEA